MLLSVHRELSQIFIFFLTPIKLTWWSSSDGKQSAHNVGDWVQSLDQEDPLGKEVATHSDILAWRIPWTEELAGLQSTGSQGVGHD